MTAGAELQHCPAVLRAGLPGGAGNLTHRRQPAGLSPGMPVMKLSTDPRQTLGAVQCLSADERPLPFSALDPVSCSELLRDLDRLAPSASGPAP